MNGVDRLAPVRRNIRLHRERRRISQADLAREVTERGIKFFPQTVQKIENGSRAIGLDEGQAIAEALGVPLDGLLDSSPVRERTLADLRRDADAALAALHAYLDATVEL